MLYIFSLKAATDYFDRLKSGYGRREEIRIASHKDHTLPYGSFAFMRVLLQKIITCAERVKKSQKEFFFPAFEFKSAEAVNTVR